MEDRRPELTEVIRDFRREQVIDAARRLFNTRSSIEVSIEEIAAEAGVSRSTVYNYFANREDVLRACLEDGHRVLVSSLRRSLAEPAPLAEQLKRLFEVVLDKVGDTAGFFRLAVTLQSAGSELGLTTRAALGVLGLEVGTILDDLVQQGFDDGVLRPADPERVKSLIGQVLFGAVSARTDDPSPPPAAESAAELRDLLLFGLGRVQ